MIANEVTKSDKMDTRCKISMGKKDLLMTPLKNYKDFIIENLEELPPELIQEVIDFIQFLKIKRMKQSGVDNESLLLQQESLNRIWEPESEDIYEL